jgi:hypothetical protein
MFGVTVYVWCHSLCFGCISSPGVLHLDIRAGEKWKGTFERVLLEKERGEADDRAKEEAGWNTIDEKELEDAIAAANALDEGTDGAAGTQESKEGKEGKEAKSEDKDTGPPKLEGGKKDRTWSWERTRTWSWSTPDKKLAGPPPLRARHGSAPHGSGPMIGEEEAEGGSKGGPSSLSSANRIRTWSWSTAEERTLPTDAGPLNHGGQPADTMCTNLRPCRLHLNIHGRPDACMLMVRWGYRAPIADCVPC